MKRPNLWIIEMDEAKETHINGIENTFSKIIGENLPNLKV